MLRGVYRSCKTRKYIHLTPENPSYESGSWHVEGQLVSFTLSILPFLEIIFGKNEHIWATALYYYSNESIKDSNFNFRQQSSTEAVNETECQQDYYDWFPVIFGL